MIRGLENLKHLHYTGLPLTKVYNVWAKKVERSYVWWHWRLMQNLKENWFVLLKLTWGIWKIYTRELESLEILTLMGFFCPKLENVWAENLQESYLSWQWKKMQNWKKNWLVVSELTWGLWWVLTRAIENLKNLRFNGLPLTKVYNVWAKKVQGSYIWWHWILMQKLKENWLLLSKMTWGICEIFTRLLESLKIWTLMGFFYPK